MGVISYFKTPKHKQAATLPANAEKAQLDAATLTADRLELPDLNDTSTAALAEGINNLKCDIMADYLHQQQQQRRWIQDNSDQGVVLKRAKNSFACCPVSLRENDVGFLRAVEMLNVRVRFLMLIHCSNLTTAGCNHRSHTCDQAV